MAAGRFQRSGDARVLGELIDVAVRGAGVDPGVPTFVDPGLLEDLHACGPQFGGRVLDVVDQEPGDRAGGDGVGGMLGRTGDDRCSVAWWGLRLW
jgi:hypothetical protein